MSETSGPKITRRTLIAGAAGRGRGNGGARGRQLLAGLAPECLTQRGQEGDHHWNRRDGSAALGTDDEGRAASQSGKAARRRRIQPPGHEHSAAEPRRLGQLHQRGRAGRPRNLRLHPSPSRGPVCTFLLGCRDDSGQGRVGGRRSPAPARFLAVQPQAARPRCSGGRERRSGITWTPRACRRRFTTSPATTRPARRITAIIAASAAWARPDMLGTYGTYQHFAENGPAEPLDEGGGKRSRLTFDDDTRHGQARRA